MRRLRTSTREVMLLLLLVFAVAALLSRRGAEADAAPVGPSCPAPAPTPLQVWCVWEDPQTHLCMAHWVGYVPPPPLPGEDGGAP